MPQALAVDWNEVKILALAIGVREAARQLGLNEDAVRQRSCREGWLKERDELAVRTEAAIAQKRERQGLSPTVTTAAEVLRNMGENTRAKLATGLNKAAQTVSEMDGQEVLMAAQQVQQITKSAQVIHGWAQSVEHTVRLDAVKDATDGMILDAEFEQLSE